MTGTITPGRRRLAGIAVAIPLSLGLGVGAVADDVHHQPVLEAADPNLMFEVDGHTFKDLNRNGALDDYEDWRLPVEQRVTNLVSQMTLAEKAGLMLIDTLNSGCGGAVVDPATRFFTKENMHRFIFRNPIDSTPNCALATPVVTAYEAATFTNAVQAKSEATRLGIPSLFKSNARNHIDPDARTGINVSAGAMSAFPKEAGIAAALGEGDMDVVEQFASVMGEEWSSFGLRGMYGYMADLSTDPRWYRVHETFTEDADLAADIMRTLVQNLQGPVDAAGVSLTPETDVALTMKHFPGGGPQELGLDPHYAHGKTQVYTPGGFENALKPFRAAIDAGVSAIMPYYGAPMNVTYQGTTFQQTGFAFSEEIVTWLLREQLGFRGYVNSDTGIINDRAWGLETATVPQRVAAAINGGTDTLSGFNTVQTILDLVAAGQVSEARVTEAAVRLLTPMFQLGLFEDPYVDRSVAAATVGASQDVGLDVQRKSIVLLKNGEGQGRSLGNTPLPLKAGSRVYLLGAYNADQVDDYGFTIINGNDPAFAPGTGAARRADVAVINVTASSTKLVPGTNVRASAAYRSNFTGTGWYTPNPEGMTKPATFNGATKMTDSDFYAIGGMDPAYGVNPIVMPGVPGLDGMSPWGASDRCVHDATVIDGVNQNLNVPNPTPACTDNTLRFGGSLPWEAGVLDFTGMARSQSWVISPSLDQIQRAMQEAGSKDTVLHIYFRQPYVLDKASGLQKAGAIVAGFGTTDTALFDVLSGKVAPQGRMPFALANNVTAISTQAPDQPGYAPRDTLYPFGWGLTY